jgi:HK97 family phage prohead protease
MPMPETFAAPAELKFLDNEPEGTLGGLGSVFGNEDSHGDVVLPGAFKDTLAQHKSNGSMPRMYVEHSAFVGGDPLPIGVWTEMEEVSDGLRVKGRLVGMTVPHISRVSELIKAHALRGLSIGFATNPGGAILGRKSTEPKRQLKSVQLFSVDLVGDPSNARARVESYKSLMMQGDQQAACDALAKAMALHLSSLAGGNSPTVEQRSNMLAHLQDAHHALTGQRMPPGMKTAETIRELEAWLHDPVDGLGWSISKARAVAAGGFKAAEHSRDGDGETTVIDREALTELTASLAGFSLPSF